MEHHVTWLHFLPGFVQLEHYFASHYSGLMGNPATIQAVAAAWLVAMLMLWTGWQTRKSLAQASDGGVVPSGDLSSRTLLELYATLLHKQMKSIIGKDCDRYFSVIATLGLFIMFSNLLGLLPGFMPPTDNWNTTMACGVFVFLYYHYHGIRVQGIGHFLHMANPIGQPIGWVLAPLFLPIELVSHISRPFSLGVRLATNMMGDHIVLVTLLGMVPLLVPIPLMVLGMIVCFVQTMVFVLLSCIYLAMATADHHEADGHA